MNKVVHFPRGGFVQFISRRASYGWFIRIAFINRETHNRHKQRSNED